MGLQYSMLAMFYCTDKQGADAHVNVNVNVTK